MPLTRRRFITAGSTAAFALAAPMLARRGTALAGSTRPLPILPEIDATASNAFKLTAMAGETAFVPGVPSPTLGFNQPYLGPVVRVRTGSRVAATVANRTAGPVSVHWHGLLVPGDVDGGPHLPIPAGGGWRPVLPISQPPATLWYHTHLHGETAEKVYAGLAGVLIVEDGHDRERGLPSTAGVDDLVLVLQDKRLDAEGRLVYQPEAPDRMHGFLGTTILVNGAAHPLATVPAGIVRLRLLNAANARNFDLRFEDGRPFHLAATEQGLLAAPIELDRLRLTPGERAEVLVDFGAHGAARLTSLPHGETGGTMAMGGMMHAMVPLQETFAAPFPLVDFAVDADLPANVRVSPPAFDTEAAMPSEPTVTRAFILNDMGMMGDGMMMGGDMTFAINGQPFDMRRLDLTIAAGSTERWIVTSQMMGHPFHVHGVRFRVESENGAAPRPENRGWKDTVFVEGEAVLVTRFDQPAAADMPFMFHCHILEHEDAGMMGQFAVV